MVSVAQKTLFFTFMLVFNLINTQIGHAYDAPSIKKAENLIYSVSLAGLKLGDAVITYKPNTEKRTYRILAKVKTKGFAKTLYKIKNSIAVNGYIVNDSLQMNNHTIILDEVGHKSSKTASVDLKNNILAVKNNKSGELWNFVLIDNAKDIFSTMLNIRFNTDLNKSDEPININRTTLYAHKTVKNKIYISAPFNYKVGKKEKIKARNIVVESQRIALDSLSKESLLMINIGKKTAKNYEKESINSKKYKAAKNLRVVVTSDERKLPLEIEYATKFGTFKAKLKQIK